jgi:hypothetical protein
MSADAARRHAGRAAPSQENGLFLLLVEFDEVDTAGPCLAVARITNAAEGVRRLARVLDLAAVFGAIFNV